MRVDAFDRAFKKGGIMRSRREGSCVQEGRDRAFKKGGIKVGENVYVTIVFVGTLF